MKASKQLDEVALTMVMGSVVASEMNIRLVLLGKGEFDARQVKLRVLWVKETLTGHFMTPDPRESEPPAWAV